MEPLSAACLFSGREYAFVLFHVRRNRRGLPRCSGGLQPEALVAGSLRRSRRFALSGRGLLASLHAIMVVGTAGALSAIVSDGSGSAGSGVASDSAGSAGSGVASDSAGQAGSGLASDRMGSAGSGAVSDGAGSAESGGTSGTSFARSASTGFAPRMSECPSAPSSCSAALSTPLSDTSPLVGCSVPLSPAAMGGSSAETVPAAPISIPI